MLARHLCIYFAVLLFSASAVRAQDLVENAFRIPTKDAGKKGLEAVMVRPNERGPHPLVVLTHGTPREASDRPGMSPWQMVPQAREFARRGWTTVIVMRRGYDPDGNFYVQRTEKVETIRMDDLGSNITVDYLKIDVQGYELEIMRHGTTKLSNAAVIECEVEFLPMYRKQPLFGDVQCFLRDQGFVLHKLIDVGGRPFIDHSPRPILACP